MTFREKLLLEHPEKVDERYIGGCYGCPHKYGYEQEDNCLYRQSGMFAFLYKQCRECWNREMKGLTITKFNGKWIPVAERLPEENTRVLLTIQARGRDSRVRSSYYFDGIFLNDNGVLWNAKDKRLKAWMYQPEPYKGEE